MAYRKTLSVATVAMFIFNLNAVAASAKPPPKKTAEELRLEEATRLSEEGKEAFRNGEYMKAAAAYMLAYSKTSKATTLFNAARAYQKADMYEQAIPLFEEYAARKDAEEQGKVDAAEHIREMKAEIAKRKAAREPPKDPTLMIPPSITTTSSEEPTPPGRTFTWSLIIGGGVLAASGTTGFFIGNSQINEANTSTDWAAPDVESSYRETVSGAKNLRTVSGIVAGIGIVAASYGLFRLFTEPAAKPKATSNPVITPVILKNGAALALKFRL